MNNKVTECFEQDLKIHNLLQNILEFKQIRKRTKHNYQFTEISGGFTP